MGVIDMLVYPSRAPASARAFLAFVDDGSFTREGAFYRVVRKHDNDLGQPTIDVVQGGLQEVPQRSPGIEHETTLQTALRHLDGSVSLARGAVGTATGAALFICVGDQPALDAGGGRNSDGQGFAVFGRVISGMDTVRAIHQLPTRGQLLDPPVRILRAARNDSAESP